MNKNVEMIEGGLQCDNPSCDWVDKSITFDQMFEWINSPCPKCGENVLTEQDYKNVVDMNNIVNYVNSLSEEEISEQSKGFDLKAFGDFLPTDLLSMTVDLHKKITITDIKKLE